MKTIIRNASVVLPSGKVQETDIVIEQDKIASVGKSPEGVVYDREIDGRNKLAIPGFVNAHTHASMTLLRSYADDMSLMDWLSQEIWPIEAKMQREDIYWGAALAAVEMIQSGTTAFADMYGPWMVEVAKIIDESGLRGAIFRAPIVTASLEGAEKTLLTDCLYFSMTRLSVNGKFSDVADNDSFVSLLVLNGTGTLSDGEHIYPLQKGVSTFIPAGFGKYSLEGNMTLLETRV